MKIRIEHIIVTAVVQALTEADDYVTAIIDPYDNYCSKVLPGTTAIDIAKEALDMEITRLITESGKWITVIDGNGEDVISDYHIGLSDIIEPVTELFQD